MRSPSKDMALEITRAASGGTPMVADAVEESVQAAVRAHSSGGESRGTSYGRRCAELLWRSAALQKPVYNQLFCIQGLSSMSTARLRQWDPCKLDETWWNCRHATFLSTRRHYSDTFILRYHSFDTQVRHSLQKQSLTPVVCVCVVWRKDQQTHQCHQCPCEMIQDWGYHGLSVSAFFWHEHNIIP